MPTFVQWVHVMAAVVGLGGMGFLLVVLMPALGVLTAEQRTALSAKVAGRFRWVSWSAILVLLISGLDNVRRYYWEEPWDRAWVFLTVKVLLSFCLFGIVLALTLPSQLFEPLKSRRRMWLLVAFLLGVVVVLISAYLRRG